MLRQGTTFTLPRASSEIFAGGQGKAAKHHSKFSIEEANASVNRAMGMRIRTRKRDHPPCAITHLYELDKRCSGGRELGRGWPIILEMAAESI